MTDDDRVAYLAGEEGPDVDDGTRADLDDLRTLLADEAVWASPPASLEDAVVAAVSAAAASGRAPIAPADAGPVRRAPSPPVASLAAHRRSRRLLVPAVAAAAVVALAVAGVVALRGGEDAAEFAAPLEPTDLVPGAAGTAEFRRTDSGWRIDIDATGLPRLADGRFYQAWLRSPDEVLVPIGTFNEGADVVLWAGVSPEVFPTLTVTEEAADGDQASSGRRVLVGTVDLP